MRYLKGHLFLIRLNFLSDNSVINVANNFSDKMKIKKYIA